MSVADVKAITAHHHLGGHHRPAWEHHKSLADAKVGQEVSLQIAGKVAEDRYIALVGDAKYTVQSSVEFRVGQTVKATVSALGGIVELKYVGGGQFELSSAEAGAESAVEFNASALGTAQAKYKIALPTEDKQLVERLSKTVARPEVLAMSALYLSKLSTPIDGDSLNALYGKQTWSDISGIAVSAGVDISALISGVQQGNAAAIDRLAGLLGDAVEQEMLSAGQATAEQPAIALQNINVEIGKDQASAAGGDSLDDLAHQLLNLQDSGTLAYHYGSVPVLVANQLVELDLVMFREREGASKSSGMRKLVMTLKTETLGRVEIVAQSFENALSISIGTQLPEATEMLAQHANEVRELVRNLGWNVDSVSYRLVNDPARAADQLVRHVLNSGTLDAVV